MLELLLGISPCFLQQITQLFFPGEHLQCTEAELHKTQCGCVHLKDPECVHSHTYTAPQISVSLRDRTSLLATRTHLSVYNLLWGKHVKGIRHTLKFQIKIHQDRNISVCPFLQTRFTDWHWEPNASFTSSGHQTPPGMVAKSVKHKWIPKRAKFGAKQESWQILKRFAFSCLRGKKIN